MLDDGTQTFSDESSSHFVSFNSELFATRSHPNSSLYNWKSLLLPVVSYETILPPQCAICLHNICLSLQLKLFSLNSKGFSIEENKKCTRNFPILLDLVKTNFIVPPLMHFIHNFNSECLMKCLRSSECDRSGKSSGEESYSKVRGCGKYAILMRCYAIAFFPGQRRKHLGNILL